MTWRIDNAGPDAVIIRFGDCIDETLVPKIRCATDRIQTTLGSRVRDLVPSYTTLLVCYDLLQDDFASIYQALEPLLSNLEPSPQNSETARLVEIPVYYGPQTGFDLDALARDKDLTTDEIIRIHSEKEYRVFAIGFAPGFAYLGSVDARIASPRLATPREKIPAGSVGIADIQTAIYPLTSPGGWNIVGRTPWAMFDPQRDGQTCVKTGDRVRFVSISRQDYLAAGGEL